MQAKRNIVHLPVYQPGKPVEDVKREFGLQEVVKLASNENPYGSSPQVREAIIAEIDNNSIYPDGASVELTAALAAASGRGGGAAHLGQRRRRDYPDAGQSVLGARG